MTLIFRMTAESFAGNSRRYGWIDQRQDNSPTTPGSGPSALDPVQGAAGYHAASAVPSSTVYLGIGAGVGGVLLIAIVVIIVQIVRKKQQHKRAVAELDDSQEIQVRREQEIGEVPRPLSAARCSTLNPLHGKAGWGALSSDETVHDSQAVRSGIKKRDTVTLPKKLKQRGIQLKRLKHLSAILESPRSRSAKSPSSAVQEIVPVPPKQFSTIRKVQTLNQIVGKDNASDVFVCPGSPKPSVLPSYAIRSPGMYGAAIANDEKPKVPRSVSVGALLRPVPGNAMPGEASRLSRPQMHARSISLGAPPTRPPSGPVPPLPKTALYAAGIDLGNRQALHISRVSSSSQESASSSVLVSSPILIHKERKSASSPSVEDVVADDDSAQLKTVLNRQWQNPLITGPRPMAPRLDSDPLPAKSRSSIRSNTAHYSTESLASRRHSSCSISSSISEPQDRLAIPQLATADRISISRVSSSNSLSSSGRGIGNGVRKVSTPRKTSRTSVSVYGSPAERRKTSVLRDISGNAVNSPSRQPSSATQDSGRSSNGNPFQWDQPLPKPSALKGSPNARKGHRRQNCVRISTLTPQVLGPPPSRPTSPIIMHGIEEESAEGEEGPEKVDSGEGTRFVTNQRLSRPPSASSLAFNLRVQTLRASLTPSSPTLSTWTAYQEQSASCDVGGLASQHSDSHISVSPITARTASRQSNRSSALSIPVFPSPSKATVSVQQEQPVPRFYLSRPSTDSPGGDRSSSIFEAVNFSPNVDMPSSPPLPVSKEQEYDPAWRGSTSTIPRQVEEYDPASPVWQEGVEPERSSPVFAFAAAAPVLEQREHVSPRSLAFTKIKRCETRAERKASEEVEGQDRPVSPPSKPGSYSRSGTMPDSPPCSPKTMPEGFKAFFDKRAEPKQKAAEKLTSANASAVMASMPSTQLLGVDFPGAPILSPPQHSNDPQPKQRTVSQFQPSRPAPPIPPSDTCIMPSPLQIKSNTSPQGPRSEPAKSVLNNVLALRRMNSQVDQTRSANRESRRYVRLGREASPLLPFIGSPDPSESFNDLFDFDFGSADVEAGATDAGDIQTSALDDIDMTDFDRRLDGALAGFDAEPAAESRSSSVWDDGERFWEHQQAPGEMRASSPLPECLTPTKNGGKGLVTPTGNLKMPAPDMGMQTLPRSSIGRTPKSLYDSDGFLRT